MFGFHGVSLGGAWIRANAVREENRRKQRDAAQFRDDDEEDEAKSEGKKGRENLVGHCAIPQIRYDYLM